MDMILKGKCPYYSWDNKFHMYGEDKVDYFLKANEFRNLVAETKKNISTLSKDNKIEEGDRVFFHSSSSIPRYKFSNFTQDKKINRVIKLDKATKIVVNTDNLLAKVKATYNYPREYVMLPHDFFENIKGCPTVPYTLQPGEFHFMDLYTYTQIQNYNKGKFILPDIKTLNKVNVFDLGLTDKTALDTIEDLKQIQKEGRYVEDRVLNEQMGEGFTTIDNTNYDEYDAMLKAKDIQTVQTGLELVANTNYKDSIFYISLLLNGNMNVINAFQNKSVNIKNFLEHFRDVKWAEGVPKFLDSLRKRLKNEGVLDEIKNSYIQKNMLNYVNSVINHANVKVTEVEFLD